MKRHTEWEDLPPATQRVVESHCGSKQGVVYVDGARSGLAARFYGNAREVYLKAITRGRADTSRYRREWQTAQSMPKAAPVPRLLWSEEESGWLVYAFQLIDGDDPRADLKHGSTDLPYVFDGLNRLRSTLTPCPVEVRSVVEYVTRLSFVGDRMLEQSEQVPGESVFKAALEGFTPDSLAGGDTLLNCRLDSRQLLVEERKVYVSGWTEPSRGEAWIEPALFAAASPTMTWDSASGPPELPPISRRRLIRRPWRRHCGRIAYSRCPVDRVESTA
ncbi:hypothetical protein [Nonomuraea sp. KM90]|uniref:hypothetical protein n=1 Tax=Nonomuraea sp. KM90 TaxID=3457428 RepID=UPI003FCEC6A8